jgi:ubiquinone/menaquinone biosynthesis C-methylase UbiE
VNLLNADEKYKKVVQTAFDEASNGYDMPAMRFFDNSAQNLAKALALKGHENILDAATGTGKIAMALAAHLKQGHVTGVDLSAGMLALAQKKALHAGFKNISFVQADVDAVDFPAGHFDGLTCGFGVHFWSDMETSLARLVRMVKNQGFVAITSFQKGSFEPQAGLCLKRFADFGVKLPDSYSLERLDEPEKNQRLFEAVGLKNIQFTETQVGYYLRSADDWWDLVLYTGYRAFLNQLTTEQGARFKTEFLRDVAATQDAKGLFLNVKVITALGWTD